jgi:beta-lactamase regulating signal transducer with metallopeptidase domain
MFITVLNMSLIASYAALAVILVRLLISKAPKIYSYALWAVVLFRMVCPVSFKSTISLIPGKTDVIPHDIVFSQNPAIQTGIRNIDNTLNQSVAYSLPPVNPAASVNPMGIFLEIAAIIWLLGIAVLLCYSAVSYIRIRYRLSDATLVEDNIFETDRVKTPFVLGFTRPKIYIPTGLARNQLDYILKHEKIHIKHRDYLIKPIAFFALVLHWFNPIMWVCYFLMAKDMEMSCDESVMNQTSEDIRANYSNSLLLLSAKQSGLLSPLAFGESNVKSRIRNVLNYKKPAFWITVVAVAAVTAAAIGLMANPADRVVSSSTADKLFDCKTEYVGDASKVGSIASLLGYPERISYDYIELHTGSTPYAVTVHLKTDTKTKDYYSQAAYQAPFEKNAIIMFSLIGNADYINFNISDGSSDYMVQYSRDRANKNMGRDVREFAQGPEELEQLLGMAEHFDNTGIGGHQNSPGNTAEGEIRPVSVIIEENIDIIMSSPKESSNPQDYINAHRNEYESILKLGDQALDYLLSQFKKGGTNDLRGHIMMRLCKDMLGDRQSESDDTLLPKEWYSQLTIYEETRLPNFDYDGSDPIQSLVYAIEVENNTSSYRGGFVVVAPKIHAYYEAGGMLKVFVTTYYGNYHLYGKTLSPDGAGVVPAAITYVKDGKGEYKLEEYRQAMDVSYFAKSIEDFCTMPVSGKKIEGLAELILNHYGNYDDVTALHRENLIKHLKANNQTGVKYRLPDGEVVQLT